MKISPLLLSTRGSAGHYVDYLLLCILSLGIVYYGLQQAIVLGLLETGEEGLHVGVGVTAQYSSAFPSCGELWRWRSLPCSMNRCGARSSSASQASTTLELDDVETRGTRLSGLPQVPFAPGIPHGKVASNMSDRGVAPDRQDHVAYIFSLTSFR